MRGQSARLSCLLRSCLNQDRFDRARYCFIVSAFLVGIHCCFSPFVFSQNAFRNGNSPHLFSEPEQTESKEASPPTFPEEPVAKTIERLEQEAQTEREVPTSQLLWKYSWHSNRDVRVKSLSLMTNSAPNRLLRERVTAMTTKDSDPVVRGHARLLAADWGLFRGPQQDNKESSPAPLANSNQILTQPPNTQSHELAPLGITRPGYSSPIQDIESRIESKTAEMTSFAPVVPFWEAKQQHYPQHGSPADVARKIEPLSDSKIHLLNATMQLDPLDRSLEPVIPEVDQSPDDVAFGLFLAEQEAPLGFTGPSGILPTEQQQNSHFVPIEDRWRGGFPAWDRYDRGHPGIEDYPFAEGAWYDPYNQNVIKGDYPIIGQHTFLNLTATSFMVQEFRQVPTATTPFESTQRPNSEEFFGNPNQYFYNHDFILNVDLFHGSAAFKQVDWRIRFQPIFNVNVLDTEELAVVYPDVRRGTQRNDTDLSLEQWFVEAKLADLSPDYDFLSVRAGSQPFVSDFRGFVFKDVNRGVRLFGTRLANRDQFNLMWLDQTDKDTNSMLNNFEDRHQNTFIANYFRQDFVYPGFTGEVSFLYNKDGPSFKFDDNDFLVRPDPTGVFQPHRVDAYYLGLGGDGHIGRMNISAQLYQALGSDSLNPIGNEPQSINAQMAAIELSVDRDWIRFRSSYFYASGDNDPNDGEAGGFDTILDDPVFAGGEFSYWQRQSLKLFGANLVQRKSLVPNLRTSKTQGQSNFVNPGLHLVNLGMDFEVTPKMKIVSNVNYLWFDTTKVLETYTFQSDIGRDIGTDISLGMEYRPLQNDNVIFLLGSAVLIPAGGMRDLYGKIDPFTIGEASARNIEVETLQSHFLELIMTY